MVKTELTLESLLIYLQSLNFAELDSNCGILTSEQALNLQREIQANYINSENLLFGQRCNDIRQCLFNFDNPYIFIKLEKIMIIKEENNNFVKLKNKFNLIKRENDNLFINWY